MAISTSVPPLRNSLLTLSISPGEAFSITSRHQSRSQPSTEPRSLRASKIALISDLQLPSYVGSNCIATELGIRTAFSLPIGNKPIGKQSKNIKQKKVAF